MPPFTRGPRRTGTVLAVLMVLTLSAACSDAASSSQRANSIFVAPNGSDSSSCRSSKNACASFNRAYQVARPGQTVKVAGGSYPAQQIVAALGKGGPNIVFKPARGAKVVVSGISFGSGGEPKLGPSHITMAGMTMARKGTQPGAGNQYSIFVGPGSRFIQLNHMDAGSVDTWLADHVTVVGGDYGPCAAIGFGQNVCGNNKIDVSSNVTIDGATFHDLRFDGSCFRGGADCHWECMYINGGRNVTVRRSKFRDCALFDIFATISGPVAAATGHQNLTIENNWFDTPWDENPRAAPRRVRSSAVTLAWCASAPLGYRNVNIRFNSFQQNTGLDIDPTPICTFQNVRVTANLLMYAGTCNPKVTYAYNRWSSGYRRGRCGETDRIGGRSFPYVNPKSGAGFNFHLRKGRSGLDNVVPGSVIGGCPVKDVDRQRRPLNGRCDVGSDERRLPR